MIELEAIPKEKLITGVVLIITGIVIITVAVVTAINKLKDKDKYEEVTPQERMYNAITTLVYIVIILIVLAVIARLLFWGSIVSFFKL